MNANTNTLTLDSLNRVNVLPGSRETDRVVGKDEGDGSEQQRLVSASLHCCQLGMTFPKLGGEGEVERELWLAPARLGLV